MSRKCFLLNLPGNQYAIPRRAKAISSLIFVHQGEFLNWSPPLFNIPPNDGIISDYMYSNVGGRLCSKKLKNIIDASKAEQDIIQWLPVDIYLEDTEETLRYYHLHFPEPLDCLNLKHSKYLPDNSLLVPFYSYKNMKKRHIFNCANGFENTNILLSTHMLKVLEQSECTGLAFSPAPVIYDEDEKPSKKVS